MKLRLEYPSPLNRRNKWLPLNGEWDFTFDDNNIGIKEQYYLGNKNFDLKINVPFTYEYKDSGLGLEEIHDIVWYKRTFNVDELLNDNILLCFNGVDYQCDVYINGEHLYSHMGGYSPFKVDITKYVHSGDNLLVVRVYDPQKADHPRGKQTWKGKNFECFYLPNTGIWQSVWLETFNVDYIKNRSIFTDIDICLVTGEIENKYNLATKAVIEIYDNEQLLIKEEVNFSNWGRANYQIKMNNPILWDLDNPHLYNIVYKLYRDDVLCDIITSRFGFRTFGIENGVICLNHKPLYQRLILDQGYWKESGITPPSIEALKQDILLSMEMGFNGARKHQKIEDPYWYYFADELGFLTWCEMPSAYEFCTSEVVNYLRDWTQIVKEQRNYTSLITFVPLNESWGVGDIFHNEDQMNLGRAMYYISKTLAKDRIVSINDGWENPSESDIVSAHDYCKDKGPIISAFKDKIPEIIISPRRHLMCKDNEYKGQPILFSEFGGVMLEKDSGGGNWGYGDNAKNEQEIYDRIQNLIEGIHECPFQGYCYTQLTDVQQEVNGLLDENHQPKFDHQILKSLFK